jgi:hypothetical protein
VLTRKWQFLFFLKIEDKGGSKKGIDLLFCYRNCQSSFGSISIIKGNRIFRRTMRPDYSQAGFKGQKFAQRSGQIITPFISPIANSGQVIIEYKGSSEGRIIKKLLFPNKAVAKSKKGRKALGCIFS